ncbi:MAG TPA: hypothetical protein PLH29_04245 [bacterium]|nr:hypothetical protein [bacterium]
MLSLNILPNELKKEIEFRKLSGSIKILIYSISFSVLFYTVSLYGCLFYLKSYYADIASQNTIITKNTDSYNKQIKDINKQIKYIEDIQKESTLWTNVIEKLFGNLSDGIRLNKATFNKNGGAITIAGTASSRDELIALRKYLENNNDFSVISFPIQNLVEKQNINFEINLQIKFPLAAKP